MTVLEIDDINQHFGLYLVRAARIWRRTADWTLGRWGSSEATVLPLILVDAVGGGVRRGTLASELEIEGP